MRQTKLEFTSLDPDAIVDSPNFRELSPLLGLLDIFPSVGESMIHQALPVPDWATRSTLRRARAATISKEFWKRCFTTVEGAMAEDGGMKERKK